MNWRNLLNRIKSAPPSLERDLDDEMAFHREMKEREYQRAGLSAGEARLAARKRMGNLTIAREDARAAWKFQWASDLLADMRYSARALRQQPGFTAAATLALTLGLGINGILFTVFNGLALAPWAVRDPGSVVQVLSERGRSRWSGFSWPEYRYMRDHSQTMAALTASDFAGVRIGHGEAAWNASGIAAAENFFDTLGTGFAAGRGFSPAGPDVRVAAPEVILQYDFWQSRFGGDAAIVGQWVQVSGHRLQVVGVAASGFTGTSPSRVDLWLPAAWRDVFQPGVRFIDTPDSCCTEVVGRLKPGVRRAAAQAELATLSAQFRQSVSRESARVMLVAPSFLANPTTLGKVAPVFAVVGIAALLILLLACANVANLLLARGAARRREIAVRLSLGAGRARILRQLLAESLLLSLLAGALTLALANWMPGLIMRWALPPGDTLALRFSADWRVVVFLLMASFGTTFLFALLPALTSVRHGVAAGLREGGAAVSGNRLRLTLLTAQVALCATLLSGASLLVRAMQHVAGIEPGFRHQDVVLVSTGLQSSGISDEQAQAPLAALRGRLSGLSGVSSVAFASIVPLGNSFEGTIIEDPRSKEAIRTGFTRVSAGFFETLGIPLLAGRSYTPADESRKDLVIVSQALASRLWPGENPVGKNFDKREVVGMVRDVSTRGLGSNGEAQMYIPSTGTRGVSFFVRHAGTPAPLLSGIPNLVRELDKRFFPTAVAYTENVERARHSATVAASMSSAFSFMALCLAFVGLYAVAAYQVAQRTREIGVRMALGARPAQILNLVLGQTMRPVLAGAVLGIGGALALARLLSNLLYGLSPTDPAALLITVATLSATAALAVTTPTRRAAAVDPSSALRHE